ncbi:MAG: phospholipase [Sphingobacteriales bacterium]|nr:phospholipase [Sphingobacteriales bacterium]
MLMKVRIYFTLVVFSILLCTQKLAAQANKTYRINGTITIDGRERTFLLNLPPNYYESSGFSLVIAMHGGGGSANQFESTSKLTEKANKAQFIVVYPNGIKGAGLLGLQTWNAGGCCGYAMQRQIDDVNFIKQLINKLIISYEINAKKVYATGHSNGGIMAYRLACEIPDKIAAIATNSCSMMTKQPDNSARPVAILHMHSALDTRVPYKGGKGTGISHAYSPPIDSVLNSWSLKNNCPAPHKTTVDNKLFKLTKWSNCKNNTTIQYYLTYDGGHAWPGGLKGGPKGDTPSKSINANDLLWDFFQQYQLP